MPESVARWGSPWVFFCGVTTTRLRMIGAEGPYGPGAGRLRPVPGDPELVLSHLGVCVSDLDRSVRFYCEALGFEKAESHVIGSEFAALMDFDDVEVTSQFVRRGNTAIELLCFTEPTAFGDGVAPRRQPARPDPPVVPRPRRCGGRRAHRGGGRGRGRGEPYRHRSRRNRAGVRLLHRPGRRADRAHGPWGLIPSPVPSASADCASSSRSIRSALRSSMCIQRTATGIIGHSIKVSPTTHMMSPPTWRSTT